MPRSLVPPPARRKALSSRLVRGAACFAAALMGVRADLPWARLTSVFPPALTAGTTHRVRVAGVDLEDPVGLQFSDPALTAIPVPSDPAAFDVQVPSGTAPGRVEVRWKGRFGVSNPWPIVLSAGPEWTLQPTNTAPADALSLPWETGVHGRLPAARTLWFRCDGEPGSSASVRVQARELGSRLEPVLRAYSAEGAEIGSVRGGVLNWTLPASGWSLVQLHDATYRGGDDQGFRLVATRAPHLGLVHPCVLRAGETNRITLFGHRLPGGKPSPLAGPDGQAWEMVETDMVAPVPAPTDPPPPTLPPRASSAPLARATLSWAWASSNGLSNPVLLALTGDPVVTAPLGTNGGGAGLQPLRPPADFSGLFPRRGEESGVTFEARKGEVYWVEVWAERLGFPCDPRVVVQRRRAAPGPQGEVRYADVLELNDQEANPGGPEFSTVTRDPAGRFEAPEDGVYRVLVRDLFHPGTRDARHAYRLALRRETPDFSLAVLPMPPVRANDNDRAVHAVAPFLRRGQTELLKVIAFRQDGFAGDITLSVEGLPPGVASAGGIIPAGHSVGFIPLTASAAASGICRPRVTGTSGADPQRLRHAAVWAVPGPVPDHNEHAVPVAWVREPCLSVSAFEEAPVEVVPAGIGPWTVSAEGKLSLPVLVTRRGDFPGAFNVRLAGRPELDKGKEASIPEQATNATLEWSLAEVRLTPGVHRVWLQGQVAGKYRNQPEALASAAEALKAADTALASATDADRKALEERRKAAEEAHKAAEERAKPREVVFRVYSPSFEITVPAAPPTEATP